MTYFENFAVGTIAQLTAERELPGWDERSEIDYQMILQIARVPPEAYFRGSESDRAAYVREMQTIDDALIERLRAIAPNDPLVKRHDEEAPKWHSK